MQAGKGLYLSDTLLFSTMSFWLSSRSSLARPILQTGDRSEISLDKSCESRSDSAEQLRCPNRLVHEPQHASIKAARQQKSIRADCRWNRRRHHACSGPTHPEACGFLGPGAD